MALRNKYFLTLLAASTAVILVASTAHASRRTAAPIEFKAPATVPGQKAVIVGQAGERNVDKSAVPVQQVATGATGQMPYYHRARLLGGAAPAPKHHYHPAGKQGLPATPNSSNQLNQTAKSHIRSGGVVSADQWRAQGGNPDASTFEMRRDGFESDGVSSGNPAAPRTAPAPVPHDQDRNPRANSYSGPVVGAGYRESYGYQTRTNGQYYVDIRKGDTLYSLARASGSSVRELALINNIQPPYRLQIGQKIHLKQPINQAIRAPQPAIIQASVRPGTQKLPYDGVHEVRPKDTLFSLAQRYNADLDELAQINHISWPYTLKIGDCLRVPGHNNERIAPRTARPANPSSGIYEAQNDAADPVASGQLALHQEINPSLATGGVPQDLDQQHGPANLSGLKPTTASTYFKDLNWPIDDGIVIGRFNEHQEANLRLSTSVGSPVKSVAFGKVTYAGQGTASYAKRVVIRHDHGLITIYDRLDNLNVKQGQIITEGTIIGETWGSDPHMDTIFEFAVKQNNRLTDPETILKTRS